MALPMHMPVEIRRSPTDSERWFALASSIDQTVVYLSHAVADELDDRVYVAFHLPGDPEPIRCAAHLLETRPEDDHSGNAERRSLRLALTDVDAERVLSYLLVER